MFLFHISHKLINSTLINKVITSVNYNKIK